MARGTTETPADRIDELRRERVKVAGQRAELERERQAAKVVLEVSPDRRREALVEAARGRGDGDQEIRAEAERAAAVVRELEVRIGALRAAEEQIGDEQQAIFDSDDGMRHFKARAAEASQAAEAARQAAEAACAQLSTAWMDALSQWGSVRAGMKRRGEQEQAPAVVPRPDFPAPVGGGFGHMNPWPGGRRPDEELTRVTAR